MMINQFRCAKQAAPAGANRRARKACRRVLLVLMLALSWLPSASQAAAAPDPQLQAFVQAWEAARRGDRARFEQLKSGLGDYLLYPYLQYEDYRFRRATLDAAEMAAFLDAHADWAFAAGLKKAWLKALGERQRWDDLIQYAGNHSDVEIRCHWARARIEKQDTDGLLPVAQQLWAVGQSQPDACDPLFDWMRKQGGLTPQLAWLRIRRAMEARNPRLTLYLARFVDSQDRVWVERWQQQDRQGYTRIDQARHWPDQPQARDITQFGLKHLARSDADRAWHQFGQLDGSIHWSDEERGSILSEIALWSAVAHAADTSSRMHAVPEAARNDRMLEWWARNGLATGNWADVILAVAAMSEELKTSDRWTYWDARARLEMGDPEYARQQLLELSTQATYYGFLAADQLDRPYAICSLESGVDADQLEQFRQRPGTRRVLALDQAGMKSWSRNEWSLAVRGMQQQELRLAAALATEQNWPDLAIMALASSGDLKWYDWRFPLAYAPLVTEQAAKRNLDPAWVMGLMRSESAMAADAISPANARGLMQVMPDTASALARRHSYPYRGSEQLLQAEMNIVFGTTFLRELMDRFDQNPVLVSGAYNAGPGAVKRWLKSLPRSEPAIWVEILPYFETRDYIPRVLAFATIYDWRMQQPVRRISARMPSLEEAPVDVAARPSEFAEVACQAPAVSANHTVSGG